MTLSLQSASPPDRNDRAPNPPNRRITGALPEPRVPPDLGAPGPSPVTGEGTGGDPRFRALVDNVQEILSVLDPGTGEVLYVSPSVEELLGYSVAERAGADPFLDVHPEDRERVEEAFRALARVPGGRVALRHRLRHAQGGWRTMETVATNRSDDPDVGGVIVSSRDVSERVAWEERLRIQSRLLEAVGQAVIATDMTGRVTHWNPAAERMYGWSREEAVGRPIDDLVTMATANTGTVELMQRLRTGGRWSGEVEAVRRDGSRFPALVTKSLVRDADGDPVGMIGVSSDISRLKLTERALQERVKELRVLALAGEILNHQGWPLRERLQRVVDLMPSGWTVPERTMARIRLGDDVVESEGFRETPWIRSVDLRSREATGRLEVAFTGPVSQGGKDPLVPEEGEFLRNLGRLVADAADREALQRVLTQAFASIREAVLVIDPSHGARGISYVNPAAERIFGYSAEELLGQSTERLHVDHDAFRRFGRESRRSLEQAGVFHGEFSLRRKDGTTFEAEQTVTLLDPERGHEGGAVSVIRDVSERSLLERQLRQMQKMESVGQLAGGIAHDFNNVLTVIRSQVDLILMDQPDDPLTEDLTLIRTAAERASDLTAQLLAFGREQILVPRVVELGAVVKETGTLLERLVGDPIEIVMRFDPEVPPVRLDPNRLEQVLMNLVVNARDAMPEGGTLTLSTSLEHVDAHAAEAFPGLAPGDWVLLSVEDTGSGMTEGVAQRAFEPFFTTKGTGKGTGLGLAMVYGTVKQSGGSIHIESESGRGTRFLLRFPPVRAEPEPPQEASPEASGRDRSDASA